MPRKRRFLVTVLLNILITAVLFLTIEGLASVAIVTKESFFDELPRERKHSQYDEEIGWINLPDLRIENLYGPGKSFRTNSMMFRSNRETTAAVPAGKIRVVCSGDSFTMGYGVDTDAGWCQQLESRDRRFEAVNLGQGGYGVDQAYLWYERNSTKIDHDIHLFAFITEDFLRMQATTFQGYGKSHLKLENGVVVNTNRPVPRASYLVPRLPLIKEGLSQLRVVTLLHRAMTRFVTSGQDAATRDSETRSVVEKLFDDLRKTNLSRQSVFVLLYLPQRPDDVLGKESGPWRDFIRRLSADRGFLLIDLVDEVAKLPPEETAGFYGDNGHYSEKGNLRISQLLYEQMMGLPEIAAQCRQKQGPSVTGP